MPRYQGGSKQIARGIELLPQHRRFLEEVRKGEKSVYYNKRTGRISGSALAADLHVPPSTVHSWYRRYNIDLNKTLVAKAVKEMLVADAPRVADIPAIPINSVIPINSENVQIPEKKTVVTVHGSLAGKAIMNRHKEIQHLRETVIAEHKLGYDSEFWNNAGKTIDKVALAHSLGISESTVRRWIRHFEKRRGVSVPPYEVTHFNVNVFLSQCQLLVDKLTKLEERVKKIEERENQK